MSADETRQSAERGALRGPRVTRLAAVIYAATFMPRSLAAALLRAPEFSHYCHEVNR